MQLKYACTAWTDQHKPIHISPTMNENIMENITNLIPPSSQSFALPAGLSVSSNITTVEEQIIADSDDENSDNDMPALIDDQGNVVWMGDK